MVCKQMEKYLKRKETIFRLAKQISTLCEVPLLLILYGPDMPNKPETWCSESDCGIVIDKYSEEKTRNKRVRVNVKPGKNKVKNVTGDQFLGKKRNEEVKSGNSEAKKVGDDQFLGKLSLDQLKDLDRVLAGKIESVKQRIDGLKLKGGKGGGNSVKSRDFEGGFDGGLTFSDYMNVDSLLVYPIHQAVYPSFNSGYNTDLGFEFGFSNPLCTSSPVGCEDNELMVDISDLDNIKFVEDDWDVINRLVTVDEGAFAPESLRY